MHSSDQPWRTGVVPQGMHLAMGKIPAQEAARRAMLEVACPANWLMKTSDAAETPEVQRVKTLQETLKLLDRLRDSRRDWFTVKRKDGRDAFVCAPSGRQLLKLLPVLRQEARFGPAERRIEPRLLLALQCIHASLNEFQNDSELLALLEHNPRGSVSLLNGMLVQIQNGLATHAMDNHARRHQALDETYFQGIKAYFKGLAVQYPDAIVLRHELRRPGGFWSPSTAPRARELHGLMADWLEAMKQCHGAGVVGHAWRLQSDFADGLHHHVLLVLNGPDSSRSLGLCATSVSEWHDIAGEASSLLDCKMSRVDLAYRGRNGYGADTLQQELKDAAVYLSCTDGLSTFDFGGQPPQRGFRSRPKVLRAIQPLHPMVAASHQPAREQRATNTPANFEPARLKPVSEQPHLYDPVSNQPVSYPPASFEPASCKPASVQQDFYETDLYLPDGYELGNN